MSYYDVISPHHDQNYFLDLVQTRLDPFRQLRGDSGVASEVIKGGVGRSYESIDEGGGGFIVIIVFFLLRCQWRQLFCGWRR